LSAIFLSAALAACSAEAPSGEASPEQSVCAGYGFTPSTDAFSVCVAKLTQLGRVLINPPAQMLAQAMSDLSSEEDIAEARKHVS
jgi:hypothetical protein